MDVKPERQDVFYTPLYPPPPIAAAHPSSAEHQRLTDSVKQYLKLECSTMVTDPLSILEIGRRPVTIRRITNSTTDPEEKRYKCPLCASAFKRNDHLKRHTRTQHSETLSPHEQWRAKRMSAANEERTFKCPHCDSWYKRNDHLKRHVSSAHCDPPQMHYCPTCDKTFKRRDHMMRHMDMKHTPETQRFRCADCHEDFTGLENLIAHEQIQHGLTPTPRLPCPHCDVTFKRRDHMLRHVNSKHLNQVVQCPLCPSVYKRRDHLVRHLREKHKTGLASSQPHADSLEVPLQGHTVQVSGLNVPLQGHTVQVNDLNVPLQGHTVQVNEQGS